MPLLEVRRGGGATEDAQERLRIAFVLGNQRTAAQDVEFAILQLVEIAVRALSQGINDPFTAMACIDRLGSAFSRLAQRSFPGPYRYDAGQRLRIIAPPVTFPGLVDAAFNPLRNYARTSLEVMARLLETIAIVASVTTRAPDRAALLQHADMIARGAAGSLTEAADKLSIDGRFQEVRRAIAVSAECAVPGG